MQPAREAPVPSRTEGHSSNSTTVPEFLQAELSPPSRMLTTEEVAGLLRINPRTVRDLAEQWVDSGGVAGLHGKKVGSKLWRFQAQHVIDYINA